MVPNLFSRAMVIGVSCLGLVLSFPATAAAVIAAEPSAAFERLYGRLLGEFWRPAVGIHGIETTVFDYSRMKHDAQAPDSLFNQALAALDKLDPAEISNDNAAKAFWINAYNFGAIRLVINHYPVDSITSFKISLFKHPWSKKALRIGGRWYSLHEIEKEMLLKAFEDPRIVFAVSCAAVSCPDRAPEAFDAVHLDEQMDKLIRAFFRNPGKGLRLDRQAKTLTLSWILKKDSHLFPQDKGGVLGFVLPYLEATDRSWIQTHPVKIDYFDHDWTLNDLAQAEREKRR